MSILLLTGDSIEGMRAHVRACDVIRTAGVGCGLGLSLVETVQETCRELKCAQPRCSTRRVPRCEKWPRSSAEMMCETHAKTRARAPRGAGRGLRPPLRVMRGHSSHISAAAPRARSVACTPTHDAPARVSRTRGRAHASLTKHLWFNAFILSSSSPTGDSSRGVCFDVCVWVHVGCVCVMVEGGERGNGCGCVMMWGGKHARAWSPRVCVFGTNLGSEG